MPIQIPGIAPCVLICADDAGRSGESHPVLRGRRWVHSLPAFGDFKVKNKTAQGKKTPTGMMPEPEGSNKRTVIIILFLFWIIGIIVIFIKWGNF